MAEENQQDTSSNGGASDTLLSTCEDVDITSSSADLIITVSSTDSFTAEITVTGTSCQTNVTCVWDGQKWICS